MTERKLRLLIEGAYAQTATLPGFWLKYDEFRDCFNELVKNQGDEIVDIDTELPRLYPDIAFEDNYQIKGTEEVFQAIRLAPNKLTEIKELRKQIESQYKNATKADDGWVNFAIFGSGGIKEKCHEMGFVGVRQAVQCIFGKRFEFRAGNTVNHEAPVLVRDLKKVGQEQDDEQRNDEKNYKIGVVPPECETSPKQGSFIGDAIDKYAYFPRPKNIEKGKGWDIAINSLATDIALEEKWYYNEKDRLTKPILKKYLSYTFERLVYEDSLEVALAKKEKRDPQKKILENSKYSVWNTGLADSIYDPIYAFFTRNDGRNPKIKQPWIFLGFGTANSSYQNIISEFKRPPHRAEYFTDPSDLFYDGKAEQLTINWQHIFRDNINRLPIGFIKRGAPDGFRFKDVDSLNYDEKENYYKELAEAIYADDEWLQYLTTKFKNALNISLSRVAWNYKTAIPVNYFDKQNGTQKISLLLPLALEKKGIIDVALVCQHKYKPEEGVNNYEGKTIFTLEMAYNNARLIARPDSDWLKPLDDGDNK